MNHFVKPSVQPFGRQTFQHWLSICNFLSSEENKFMTPYVCVGCGFVMLYDKNRKKYRIHKSFTREKVDEIITLIKEINERP